MIYKHLSNYRGGPDFSCVGLDLSLTSTGMSHYKNGKVGACLIKPSKRRGPERLAYLRDALSDFLDYHLPEAVFLEGYSFGSKGRGTMDRAEWGGVVRLELFERDIFTGIVAPQQLKKFISGSGNTEKAAIPLHLFKRFGVEMGQNDMADAAGVAIMCAAKCSVPKLDLIKPQIEALSKVEVYYAAGIDKKSVV